MTARNSICMSMFCLMNSLILYADFLMPSLSTLTPDSMHAMADMAKSTRSSIMTEITKELSLQHNYANINAFIANETAHDTM